MTREPPDGDDFVEKAARRKVVGSVGEVDVRNRTDVRYRVETADRSLQRARRGIPEHHDPLLARGRQRAPIRDAMRRPARGAMQHLARPGVADRLKHHAAVRHAERKPPIGRERDGLCDPGHGDALKPVPCRQPPDSGKPAGDVDACHHPSVGAEGDRPRR